MEFALLENERELNQSLDGLVILTTHRIKSSYKTWGYSDLQSIMLQHVTSCENKYRAFPVFLLLAAISLLAGIMYYANYSDYSDSPAKYGGLVFAVVFFLIYLASRKNTIVISSPSAKIYIPLKANDSDFAADFICKIEEAIHDLRKNSNAFL
jgi:hypothetical protein